MKELGGVDFKKTAPKMLDNEGKEVPGNRGYKYFGAAKDLPGVRELFEQEAAHQSKKNRTEMLKQIDADYYGYMDDDDGLLIPAEDKCEKEAIRKKIDEWKTTETANGQIDETFEIPEMDSDDENYVAGRLAKSNVDVTAKDHVFIAHVPVPSQKDIERALLERKKQELLAKYVSEDLMKEEQEAKELLGK